MPNDDRCRLGLLAAAAALALAAPVPAAAQGEDAARIEALQAQVKALTAQLQALAERDDRQIQGLTAQVRALQDRLQPPPPIAQLARADSEPQTPSPADRTQPRVVQTETKRFSLVSGDGRYSIGLTGDIQFDSGAYLRFRPQSPLAGPQALSSGVNARRARIGVSGVAAGDWTYAFVWDGGNSSDQTAKGIETAQIVYSGLPGAAFELGYSNTYFTLDQATSSNDTLFLERASPSDIATAFNTGDARANAGVRLFGPRYWAGAYVTGPAAGDSHSQTGERLGAFQRVAVQALQGPDYSLHLGLGLDELIRAPRAAAGGPATLILSDQPELRIDPTVLLNTGVVGTAANPVRRGYVLDLETAATWGRLFWQGEAYGYRIDRAGLPAARFGGGYGQLAWSLTGEVHRYNPQAGSYVRITPARPFSPSRGDWGAWEIAARVSYVDLDSRLATGQGQAAAIAGGRQTAYTLGLNWYPDDLVRLLLDYNHVSFDRPNGALGAPAGARLDAVSLRAQVAY